MKMSRINYRDVSSSNILALGFENGVGYVEFGGGRRFAYTMSKAVFGQLMGAKSIGSFFAREVKGKCQVVWSGWRCDNSPCKNDATKVGHAGNNTELPPFRVCDQCAVIPRFERVTFKPVVEKNP